MKSYVEIQLLNEWI